MIARSRWLAVLVSMVSWSPLATGASQSFDLRNIGYELLKASEDFGLAESDRRFILDELLHSSSEELKDLRKEVRSRLERMGTVKTQTEPSLGDDRDEQGKNSTYSKGESVPDELTECKVSDSVDADPCPSASPEEARYRSLRDVARKRATLKVEDFLSSVRAFVKSMYGSPRTLDSLRVRIHSASLLTFGAPDETTIELRRIAQEYDDILRSTLPFTFSLLQDSDIVDDGQVRVERLVTFIRSHFVESGRGLQAHAVQRPTESLDLIDRCPDERLRLSLRVVFFHSIANNAPE